MPSSSSPPPTTTTTTTLSPPPPPPPQQPPPQPPPPSQPPPRKFPAPCWTQDETLALIHCYQDKWFSLRRRNLRTADWETVADEVNRRCPHQSPPKTSAQCRHKMEKLRKRYRAEKQRISNLPFHSNNTRFFPSSSWVFYDLMDAMEIGSAPGSGPSPIPGPGQGTPQLVVKEEKGNHVSNVQNGGKEDLGKYFDEILRSVGKTGIGGGPTTKFKVKNLNNLNHNFNHHHHQNFDNNDEEDDEGGGDDRRLFDDYGVFNNKKRKLGEEERRRMRGRGGGGGMMMNGVSASASSSLPKRGGGDEEVVTEMVASIRMLGEGMVKMEKMRMELMQDLQRQRMEFEMNNTRMILESQHNIVTAFLQGFKKQKHANNNNNNNKKIVKVVQLE